MRQGEGEQVVETFRRHQGIELIHVRAADRFFERLAGVTDPEDKRKAIGELFIRVFEEAAGGIDRRPLPRAGHALPRRHRVGHARTPPRSRATTTSAACPTTWTSSWSSRCATCSRTRSARSATELGLPDEIVWRQPFPGPGPRGAHHRRGHAREGGDAAATPTPSCARRSARPGSSGRSGRPSPCCPTSASVGVMGDERTYGHPIIIRAVTSEDAMTADWARLPVRAARDACRAASSTRWRASTGWPTTSRRSRPAPSSGSDLVRRGPAPAWRRATGASSRC